MKKLLILTILVSISYAESYRNALFAGVNGITSNDTLNVRVVPDYHSQKIGALPQDAFVGVDYCKKVGKSTWCKIFHIAQMDYEEFGWNAKAGWVNARYLKFDNRGYVIIDGKPKCDYALRCKNSKCEVVTDYTTNPNTNDITSLKTQWIKRDRLKASSNFGAVADARDGYCTNGNYIEEFLQTKKMVLKILSLLSSNKFNELTNYIHPKKGVAMSWNVRFGGKEDITFSKNEIKNTRL